MNTATKLQNLHEQILADNVCPELASQATQLVFGDGNPDADVVFIGEAPGKSEDEQGKPFVGAAGKFLNEMLESIGMKRADVYITNIVKYRPPNNRDPEPAEKKAFLPYLQAQLEIIQPKVVVTLGRHSMNCFLPDLQISKVHGEPKRLSISLKNGQRVSTMQGEAEQRSKRDEKSSARAEEASTQQRATNDGQISSSAVERDIMTLVVLPLYHPAAALYNGAMRQTLLDDFAKIPKILEKL